MATKFRPFCFKRTVPGSEVINHYSTQTLSDEFGWLVPIQDMLNNINNNFNITIYAYAYESDWEDGFYFAQPDDAGNFIRVCDYTRTYDSTSGLNTFNVSNQDLKAGINSQSYFLDDLINRGYTNVFVHPAAFQYYKFNQDPTADFSYGIPASTIIRPITILENIPDPPAPTIPTVLMPDGNYWTSIDLNVDDGQGGVSIFNDVTVNGYNFGTQYYYTHEAAMRIASNLQGYHLPTGAEVSTLMNSIGGEADDISMKLRSTYGWSNDGNGTDDYGFSVLPVGNKFYSEDRLEWGGMMTHYWLYDDSPVQDEWTRFNDLVVEYNSISMSDEIGPFGFKVRLIKD